MVHGLVVCFFPCKNYTYLGPFIGVFFSVGGWDEARQMAIV